jgi:hypothetical protein
VDTFSPRNALKSPQIASQAPIPPRIDKTPSNPPRRAAQTTACFPPISAIQSIQALLGNQKETGMKSKLIVAVLVGIGLGLATTFIAGQSDALAQQPKAQKWEHRVVRMNPERDVAESAKQLDALANDGWEYVGLVATPGGGGQTPSPSLGYLAFKRLKK